MKNKELYRRAMHLAIPMMIQNGIANMVGLVDNVMVGSLGTESMTGVSIAGQLIFVFNLAVFGGLSGPGIYGAQFYGQKNLSGFRSAFRLKYWIGLTILLLGTLVFLFAGDSLIGMYLRGNSAEIDPVLTASLSRQYLNTMLLGLPAFIIAQVYVTSLRETGCSIVPMVGGLVSVAVDVIFNYFLIYGAWGFPKLGVQGAAIASVLARYVDLAVVAGWSHCHMDTHSFLRNVYHTFRVQGTLARNIILKSMPIFFNEFLWAGGLAALTQTYSTRGLDIVAGMNISNAICNLMNVVFVAMGSAVGILIGQELGASQYEKAQKDAFRLMWFIGGLSCILTLLLAAASPVFPLCYNTTGEIRQYATYFILITAVFFPVQGFLNALYFTIRSGGKTIVTFLFDSVFTWVIVLPAASLLCRFTQMPVLGIFAVVQALDIIKLFVGVVLIRKGIWISNLAEEAAKS